MSFEVGDIVRLKSGGPRMTVTSTGDYLGTPSVWCSWFTGNTHESEVFASGAVEVVQADDPRQNVPPESSWVRARRGR